jgi:hypothetical protein
MNPAVLSYKIRSLQITIEHNFINYSQRYLFRSFGVIVRLTFRTYYEGCPISI